DAVCDAVTRCWASLHTERAVAYRRKQGVDDNGLAMAVVVQRLIDAEVAGVLFTRDPLDAEGRRMLGVPSWRARDAVVSGRVTPGSARRCAAKRSRQWQRARNPAARSGAISISRKSCRSRRR